MPGADMALGHRANSYTPRGAATMDSFIINDTDVKDAYVADLEDRVRELIGSEPKDFARAALLIYDIFRLRDEHEGARQIGRLFDVPAMVLFQVPPLLATIDRMGHTPPSATRDTVLGQIDDLNRLVIMALDGDADADVVTRLADLREVVSQTRGDRVQPEAVSAAGERLTHLVNAFFFDRLTAIPELRDYVVGLELGL